MANRTTDLPTKAERTAEARERARQLRVAARRKHRRNSLLRRWGAVAAAAALVAGGFAVITLNQRSSIPDAGAAPAHGNEYGGITLVSSTGLAETPPVAVDVTTLGENAAQDGVPSGVAAAGKGEPARIVIYTDAACSYCALFDARYSPQIGRWLDEGEVTVEYRTVAFLDQPASGNYSSRAANAMACVADTAPQRFLPFMKLLFERQGPAGMSSDDLAATATESGAGAAQDCVKEGSYRPYVKYTDALARAEGIGGTPAVYVDGKVWDNTEEFIEFAQPILDARR